MAFSQREMDRVHGRQARHVPHATMDLPDVLTPHLLPGERVLAVAQVHRIALAGFAAWYILAALPL